MTLKKIGDETRLRTKALKCVNSIMSVGLLLLLMCGLVQASDLSFNVLENQPAKTEVGEIEDGMDLYVAAKTKGVEDAFDIPILEATGSIMTSKSLDREDIEQYNMTIYNTVSGITTTVTINVIDENDNMPTFAENAITLEISELSKVGFEVNLGSALDEDAPPFNVQGYRLAEISQFFDVNTTLLDNGRTRYAALVVLKKLDRETTPFHIVTVEAFDGGFPTPKTGNITVNVTVSDSNDNAPHFQYSSYNTSISENTNVPTDVIKVEATDKDAGINGDITYSIDRTKSDPDELFEINTESGQIYLRKMLDSELATEHRLTVLATDGGAQPLVGSTIVIVTVEDINDNEPVINVIFLGSSDGKVSEAAAIGDYVARISVSDPDIGDVEKFNVSIVGGDGRFGLKTENSVVYLICLKEILDRENKSSYDLELVATDFGSPPKSASVSFTIEIEDINDNPPVFGQTAYRVNISEDSFPGTFVVHLDASDPDTGINSEFSFDLLPSNQSDWFSLNRETGLITTRTYLDHEINPQPVLQVVATDFGTPRLSSVTTVIITVGDLNDSAPKFVNSTYRVTVSEDADVQSCFLQVKATDPDFPSQPQHVTYSFVDIAPGAISLSTVGNLCLVSRLDREKIPSYEFRVKATDQGGLHDIAQVYIVVADANDNRPIFHPVSYVANVASATALSGNPVTRVMATDDDEKADSGFGNVTYEILAGNQLGLFSLDEDTGEISVAKSLVNHGSMVIQLRIRAIDDGGLSSESDAIVTISVLDGNDSSVDGPVFDESLYEFTVKENVDQERVIGTVAATSNLGTVTYTLREDPPMSSWFSINSVSGDIIAKSSVDREIYSSVLLQIMVSVGNPPVFGFTMISITVEDVNDNRPVFSAESPNANPVEGGVIRTITIPYSLLIGSLIYDVKATDADDGPNSLIRYTLADDNSYFQIDLTSGGLELKAALPKRNATYSVVIQASDHGNPPLHSTGIVVVEVLKPDVNCPAFSFNSYVFSVPENHPLAFSFDEVQATSPSKVFYEILSNADSYNFAVFPNGSLYLTSALDREFKESYEFQVQASGPPSADFTKPCTATATVLISVIDVNDNLPYFDLDSRTFYIKENEPSGTVVGVVSATDSDIGDNAKLQYSFATDNEHFEINGSSGIITTLKILDRESIISDTITVRATDISISPALSQITIRVLVEDVNDVTPSFLTSSDVSLLCVVEERKEKGTFACLLQAVDSDSGENGRISYSILSGDDTFEINAIDGIVTTTKMLNMNEQQLYSLVVQAEDHGSPPNSATSTVQIHVRASDDNPALFDQNNYVFYVPVLNADPGRKLGRFNTLRSTHRVKRQLESDIVLTNFQIVSGDDEDSFYLNETDGSLTSLAELNYERKPQYLLTVTAENSQDSGDIYTLNAQVNIEDANDFAPTFSSASYIFSIQENLPVGSKIWTFSATDEDIGINGILSYSILSELPSHQGKEESSTAFRIDPSSGELYTMADIDRESIPQYTLVIQAVDGADEPRSTTVSCVITVRDMNDYRPRFVSRSSLYIMEDEPIGFPVVCLSAEDDDLGANSHLSFAIVRGWTDVNDQTDREYFHLNPSTGLLTLTKQLDFEAATKHYINVSATDGAASDSLTAYQLLVVNVIDVNDQIPKFVKTVYQAEISEDQDVGSLITRVTANDGDSGENGKVSYELQDGTNFFSIDKDTGVIVTANDLDREMKDSYTLIVFAYDGAFPALYDWCTVEITVLDINDNLPRFAISSESVTLESGIPLLVSLEVPEYENGPALIHTVVATDSDIGENGKIKFVISDGNTDDRFTINSTTGELWTNTRLDREEISSYRLKITATDNGTPTAKSSDAYVDVSVLDWNDNDPAFSQSSYRGSVSEGLPIGQFVLTVHADDPDSELNGEINYSVDSGSEGDVLSSNKGCFSVDPQTGAITTTSILDREKKKQHQLIIQAMDSAPYGPRKSSVTVIIDVNDINDNSPIFDEKLVERNVTESIKIGAEVARVQAQDKDEGDNGTVFYQITGGNTLPFGSGTGKFHINNDGRITTTGSLTGTYTFYLNVTAHDNGNPTRSSDAVVILNVAPLDIPNFSRIQFLKSVYKVDIPETMQKGDRVTQVEARLYNDESEIDESDSVNIGYSFPSGNEDGTFSISSAGIITIKDPSFLDYEELPSIHLIVRAAAIPANGQGVTYDYTTVYVNLEDDNDNAPQFAQDRYVTKVWEQQDAGIYVLQVSAHDIDSNGNGEVRYYINSGNVDQSFQVDPLTGIVTTALTLDREIHQEYKLIVHAYDLGAPRRTGSCTLKISIVDINDHKPTLTVPSGNAPLNILESLDIGSMITRVTANDPDSGSEITFALNSNADGTDKFFFIDRFSGKIYLAEEVDYETMHDTTITVTASDGMFTDNADILINLIDENDNAPEFILKSYQATLDELSHVNTSVIRVEATDADSEDNGLVSYKLIDTLPKKPMFVVDSVTGVIYTNMTEAFNPQTSIYNLIIQAEDHGVPPLHSSVSVRVQIEDVNNFPPVFSQESYEASVSEAAERDTHVINITATDADFSKENRYVFYEISAGNVNDAFKVITHTASGGDNTVGEVVVAGDLDRENVSAYLLTIRASDQGTPRMMSEKNVVVKIKDVNDNQPVFNQTLYKGEISEHAKQEPVLMVFASDPDSSSHFIFKITSGNDDAAFDIGECIPSSEGCALISAKILNYEEKSQYKLAVQVWDDRDTSTARSSVVPVMINLLDVNEHTPHFPIPFKNAKIDETVHANQSLFTVTALDDDGGFYGKINYFISREGNNELEEGCLPAYEMFEVIQDTGEVKSRHDFDYESCRQYSFYIGAQNSVGAGAATKTMKPSFLLIFIEVNPIDEFPPIFADGGINRYRFSVPYGSTPGHIIGVVNATDMDAGSDGKIIYEIDKGDQDQEFRINATTGVITLIRSLESSSDRILSVTASSGRQSVQTFISIEITGAPAIAPEAQILAIVFGVIAAIAILIVLVLCLKHRRNKKALRYPPDSRTNAKEETEYYDLSVNRNGNPVAAPRTITVNRTGKSTSSSADYQIHNVNGISPSNGRMPTSVSTNGRVHSLENGIRSKTLSGKASGHSTISNGHTRSGMSSTTVAAPSVAYRIPRHSTSSGRGSEQDDDDDDDDEDEINREVDQITSSSGTMMNHSTSLPKPKTRRKSPGKGRSNKPVLDSGIQQDIDACSDISDGDNNIRPASVESIHIFGEEGAGEAPLDLQDIENDLEIANNMKNAGGISRTPASYKERSLTSKSDFGQGSPSYKSPLGTEKSIGSTRTSRGTEGTTDLAYNRRDHLVNWAPEFQPLANVFSEYARFKEESSTRSRNRDNIVMRDLSAVDTQPSGSDNPHSQVPPPLLTSVADQRNNIIAPVPMGYNVNRTGRQGVSTNPVGLYPQSNPHYMRASNNYPQTSYLPPLYSSAHQRRDNLPSVTPSKAQVSFARMHGGLGQASLNSSQQALSVSSLSRTPISHESSFTSPAMSPNLSQSLSPLATRSPSVSPYTVSEGPPTGVSDGSETDPQYDRSVENEERMVHV